MGNILSFAKATIPDTETTQPPIQWVLRSLCLRESGRRVKLTTPHLVLGLERIELYIHTPSPLHMLS